MSEEKETIKRMVNIVLKAAQYYEKKYGKDDRITIEFIAQWSILDTHWNELYNDEEY